MAMYPNATHGYMPFVKPAHKRQAAKRSKADDRNLVKSKTAEGTKTYKVTMRDRRGFTYTYIIQADASKNLPVLCESRVTAPDGDAGPAAASSSSASASSSPSSSSSPSPRLLSSSLPNMRAAARFPLAAPETRSCASLADPKEDLTKVGDGEKKGLFNSLLQFIKKKTSSRSRGASTKTKTMKMPVTKVKRKLKPLPQRKRQRTVSALSHLGTIHESPDEDTLWETETDNQGDTDTNLGDTDTNLGETDSLTPLSGITPSPTSSNDSESGEGQSSCPP